MPFTATPGSFTPINMWAMLRMLINQNTPILNNPGPPVNGVLGTYANQAGTGALLIDFINGVLYINVGTLASPNWSREISTISGVVQYLPFVNTGLFAELFNEGVIATGTSQNSATPTTGAIIRVTSATGVGAGVALPRAVAGLDIMLINHAGVDIVVYGNAQAGDTINDIASASGVSVMNNSIVIFVSSVAGKWYTEGLASGFSNLTGLATASFAPNVVAAGSTQASATPLTKMMNRVMTVPVGSGVSLPSAVPGEYVAIDNRDVNPLQVYGNPSFPGDTINGIATAVGITQGVNSIVTYFCFVPGNWETAFGASGLVSWLPLSVNGAVPIASHYWMITKLGVLTDTLAAPPPSPSGDGIDITISSDSPNAHVFTFPGNTLDSGGAASSTITFNPNKGASFRVVSFNSRWKLMSQIGVAAS